MRLELGAKLDVQNYMLPTKFVVVPQKGELFGAAL